MNARIAVRNFEVEVIEAGKTTRAAVSIDWDEKDLRSAKKCQKCKQMTQGRLKLLDGKTVAACMGCAIPLATEIGEGLALERAAEAQTGKVGE